MGEGGEKVADRGEILRKGTERREGREWMIVEGGQSELEEKWDRIRGWELVRRIID